MSARGVWLRDLGRLLSGCFLAVFVIAPAGRLAAAVTYQNETHAVVSSGSSITLIRPASTGDGDLLIAAVAVDDTGGSFGGSDFDAPSGWAEIDNGACPQEAGDTLRCGLASWWKIASDAEPASYDFTWGSSEPAAGVILRYKGTDGIDPIGVVGVLTGAHKANDPDPPKAPSVTTTADDVVVLRLLANDRVGPWDVGTGHTLRHNGCGGSGDPSLACIAAGDKTQAAAGPTGIMEWQKSTTLTNIYWRSLTVEILPPQPKGSIEIFKQTLPGNLPDEFSFSTTGLPGGGAFALSDGESQLFSNLTVGGGLYSVAETVPDLWTRIAYCDLGFPGNVEVVDGFTTECHFVNAHDLYLDRCDMVGRPDNLGGTGSHSPTSQSLIFDAHTPFVLRAVDVYPDTAGTVRVRLKDSLNNVMATRAVFVAPATPGERTRIELDLPVPAGTGLQLDAVGTTGTALYRNATGASYPYAGEFVSITGNTFGPDYYYYFYDWEVERLDAVGPSHKEFGGGEYNTFTNKTYFDVSEPTVIEAVHVFPGSSGTVTIELRDGAGMLLDSVTTTVPASPVGVKTPIVVDFFVPAGTEYSLGLGGSTTATLWRNSSGAVYPFSTSTVTVTGTSSPTFYYYFFDWLFRPAWVGWNVHLHDLTLDTELRVVACVEARLGPDLEIVFPASITARAGDRVIFDDPVAVESGAELVMKTSSYLLP